ncbi:MAG: exodeoxyribonuclease VII large subunit, partial [Campylobacteraceae bacterium]|nr:exodeoxyribonuclease VII large subunit [Campylobacteraceae bacterium]
MTKLTVGELNRQIKSVLESHFSLLYVSGEISNLVIHTSGHIYFSLKDSESSIRAVLFKGNAQKLKFKLENGQKVILECGLSVYPPRGEYQLMVSSV